MEELHKKYRDQVEFLAIYVREAHPTDGWRMASNDKAGIAFAQPRAMNERVALAKKCCSTLEITMPVLVDELNDRVGHAYSGMPDRLYVIDRAGRVAYKGGRGPFGFKAREMEQALVMLLLDQTGAELQTTHGLPLLSNEEARRHLPQAIEGQHQPLPTWARALAKAMPRTTAAMLELDYLQRSGKHLNPKLRARMRWVAAHANRCEYSKAYAQADLERDGRDIADAWVIGEQWDKLPPADQAALQFARKMTLDAATVTDAEVSQLMGHYGDKQVVAMVLLLAYANFQDRLILALGVPLETGGPLPAFPMRFKNDAGIAAPPRPKQADTAASVSPRVRDTEWLSLNIGDLHKNMDAQRARQPRILVPTWDEVQKNLPKTVSSGRTLRIKWSLVCMGYQPELAQAWGACTRAFGQEAKQDRVFEESLFWVVTRTLHCFY